MIIAWIVGAITESVAAPGLDQLVGRYSGPMEFRDDQLGTERSFVVDLEITRSVQSATSLWTWQYNFDPPKFSRGSEVCQPLEGGTIWHEKGGVDLRYKLRNWQQFESGKSNWFEIERTDTRDSDPKNLVVFKRRYTISSKELISEKWLKYSSKDWYRSHKMTLKRISKSGATDAEKSAIVPTVGRLSAVVLVGGDLSPSCQR